MADEPGSEEGVIARIRRDSKPIAVVEKFITAHKAIVAAVALLALGGGATAVMSTYPSYDDVRELRAQDKLIEKEIQLLKESGAEMRSAVKAITGSAKDTRDDVKELLRHVLATPQGRNE